MPRTALALCFCLSVGACTKDDGKPAVLAPNDIVRVVHIVKGDEVEVEKDGKLARVRLLGVHAFSSVMTDAQLSALAAGGVAALTELIGQKPVRLSFDKTVQDPSGRYLAYLDKDGADVGHGLVAQGWAVVYTEFPFAREQDYLAAETPARVSGRNLWGLRPAADLVRGLRRQWLEARIAHGAAPLTDALLIAP
jgi:endonuclease YncB( thermonuclease family)